MNWAGCLGVGPGGRLLIAERPLPDRREMVVPVAVDRRAPVVPSSNLYVPPTPAPKLERTKRSRRESAALRARVIASLQRSAAHKRENEQDNGTRPVETHAQIAAREGIHPSYVDYIAQVARITRVYRSKGEVQGIVAKAKELMSRAVNPLNQKQAAAACGVSPQYLCMLIARHA